MVSKTFQVRTHEWATECFGEATARDVRERNHRFVEEALELAQSCGMTAEDGHRLVDYVFGRSVGEKAQEVGGTMVTLAALCTAHDIDMMDAAETELSRITSPSVMERVRAKHKAKPRFGPLPGSIDEAAA